MNNFISKLIFFIISVIHIVWVSKINHLESILSGDVLAEQTIVYLSEKLFSVIFIIIFWQLIRITIAGLLNRDEKNTEYFKYTVFYFLLNAAVLSLTYPYMNSEMTFLGNLNDIVNLRMGWHPNWFQCFYMGVFYNIIPFIWGIPLCCIFLYSLIFASVIKETKRLTNNKLYYFLFIPFCFPTVLMLNTSSSRMIFGTWLQLFVFLYLFFNIKDKDKDKSVCEIIFIACIAAIAAQLRTEIVILLLTVPFIVFFLKVFPRKKAVIFVSVMYLLFSGLYLIERLNFDYNYEFHNLSFHYDMYLENKQKGEYDEEIEKLAGTLNKIYADGIKMGKPSDTITFDFSCGNKKSREAMSGLIKYTLKKSPEILKNKVRDIMFVQDGDFLSFMRLDISTYYDFRSDIRNMIYESFDTNTSKYKIRNYLLYLNNKPEINKHFAPIFNLSTTIVLLLILLIIGIIIKCYFVFPFFITYAFILYMALLFGVFNVYLYYYPAVFNTWIFIFLLTILQTGKLINHLNEKRPL